jgi:hypothetical protein
MMIEDHHHICVHLMKGRHLLRLTVALRHMSAGDPDPLICGGTRNQRIAGEVLILRLIAGPPGTHRYSQLSLTWIDRKND